MFADFGIGIWLQFFGASGMPQKLPTSLVKLRRLFLSMYLTEQADISSALCLMRSSPNIKKLDVMVNMAITYVVIAISIIPLTLLPIL